MRTRPIGWRGERTRHGLARQGIRTGRKITSVERFRGDEGITLRDVKEFEKINALIDLLKQEDVKAVDLYALKLNPDSAMLREFVKAQEDLEIVGHEVRKVDRKEEIERFIETKQTNIDSAIDDIAGLKKFIADEEAKLKKKIKELEALGEV
jgi:hypothetical protein